MREKKINLLIADDHPIVLEGIVRIVQRDNVTVVATAHDGSQALAKMLSYQPDVAVLDIMMPKMSGIDVAREAARKKCPTKVILLTAVLEEEFLEKAMQAGVAGYVLKENTADELVNALFHVLNGKTYVSPLIGSRLMKRKADERHKDVRMALESLTMMEKKVLALVAAHKSSKEIGKELCISAKTAQNHRASIIAKLALRGSNALLSFALENKTLIG